MRFRNFAAVCAALLASTAGNAALISTEFYSGTTDATGIGFVNNLSFGQDRAYRLALNTFGVPADASGGIIYGSYAYRDANGVAYDINDAFISVADNFVPQGQNLVALFRYPQVQYLGGGNTFTLNVTGSYNLTVMSAPQTYFELRVDTFEAVPEPATWAMLIGGFGMVGGALRVRPRKVAFSA